MNLSLLTIVVKIQRMFRRKRLMQMKFNDLANKW